MEYVKSKNIPILMFAVDFEKAFDSIEHNFVIATLRQYGFAENFIKWMKLLLSDNQSCIMINGYITDFFQVNRGTKQGNPISPYTFILILEIMATMIRNCEDIQGLKLRDKEIKLVLFADDSTFL